MIDFNKTLLYEECLNKLNCNHCYPNTVNYAEAKAKGSNLYC